MDRYWTYVHTFIEPQAFSRFIGGPYGVPEETTPAHYLADPEGAPAAAAPVTTTATDPTGTEARPGRGT